MRLALVAVAIGLLALAHRLAAPLAPRQVLSAPAWVTLLGPLRPFVAELTRLRFEAGRIRGQVLGQLEDAWSVLLLEPERPEDFAFFGHYFVFDAVRLASSTSERAACVRAGFEILAAGQRVHPRSARLRFAEALALDHFVRHAPERIAALGLPSDEPPRGRALAQFAEALALCAQDDPQRDFIRLALALCVEGILADPASVEPLRARAREAAERLLAEDDLPAETRSALRAGLDAPR